MRRSLAILLATLGIAEAASAVDGVLEVNQVCAETTGCFPGDAGGFPVTLGQAGGSYVLTSSLVVTNPNQNAVEATTGRTTLDLNGFEVRGPGSCTGTGSAIVCLVGGTGIGISSGGGDSMTVLNGSVKGFGGAGISIGVTSRVQNVIASENPGDGIVVGPRSRVDRCEGSRNGGVGIMTGNTGQAVDSSHVEDSGAYGNGSEGIQVGHDSLVLDCRASDNGGDGIEFDSGSIVATSTAVDNEGAGLSGQDAVLVARCTSSNNDGNGITVVRAGIVRDSTASGGFRGISTGLGALVSGNTTLDNSQQGIFVDGHSLVTENTSQQNGSNGIELGADFAAAQRNLSNGNGGTGIAMNATCSYRGNVVRDNAGASVGGAIDMGANSCGGTTSCP